MESIKKAIKIKSNKHIQEVEKILCIANSPGYYGGLVIKAGQKFRYSGPLKNGKFPLWCDSADEFVSDFSKLVDHEPEEKDMNLKNDEDQGEGQSQGGGLSDLL